MAVNRFRDHSEPKHAHGKLYEPKAAKKLGARLQPNSGATAGAKGDLIKRSGLSPTLFESKTTIHSTLSIDLGWLVKITEEANSKGLTPALVFSFVLPNGRPRPNCESEWVALPLSVYKELTDGQ